MKHKPTEPMPAVEYTPDELDARRKDMRLRFDGKITLGNVISIVSMLTMILAAWRNMESRLIIVEERVKVQTAAVERIEKKVESLANNQRRPPPFNTP